MSEIPLTKVRHSLLLAKNISLQLLREDLNHPLVGGNKWRKLKYNLVEAEKIGSVVSLGGVYSNHLYALSALCKAHNLKCVALVRENDIQTNPTLDFIRDQGTEIRFIDRTTFRKYRQDSELVESIFPKHYFIPEGGSNHLALKGCEEIGPLIPEGIDVVTAPVGTGHTVAGIINSVSESVEVIGFPAVKENYLNESIRNLLSDAEGRNWRLERGYHLGGIGEYHTEYIGFLNQFYLETKVRLDPIYNGKMLYGLFQMISNNTFAEGINIVAVVTGGQQGIEGFNHRFPSLLKY